MTEATTTAEVDKTAETTTDTKAAETTTQSTTAATTEAAKTADTTTTATDTKASDEAKTEVKSAWGDTWREEMAGGDDDVAKAIARYGSQGCSAGSA
jgi:hypothetical protein